MGLRRDPPSIANYAVPLSRSQFPADKDALSGGFFHAAPSCLARIATGVVVGGCTGGCVTVWMTFGFVLSESLENSAGDD